MTPGLPPDGGSLAQALRALARETAEMPVPELDWDRIERALAVQVEGSREPAAQVPAKRPRVVGSPWVIACAAAAVVAVVYASQSGRLRAVTARSEAKLPSVAEAGSSVLTYERAGVVSFSLDPESRIEVTQGSAAGAPFPMTVVLLSGTIHAEVAPQPNGEVFAVEVGRTRIAVHGTSFSVSREGDEAIVDVSHGSVAVGPTGHPGSTQGWLLVGPERAAFSLDGATHVRWLTAPAVGAQVSGVSSVSSAKVLSVPDPSSDVAAAQGRRSPRSRRDEAPAEAARAPVEAPKASPAEATPSEEHEADTAEHRQVAQGGRSEQAATAAIVRGLRACYEKQLRSLGVRFSIQSSLSLTVLPTGVVREGVFNPPLSPTLLECVRDSIGAARFPVGATTREVRLPVSLSPPAGE